MPSNAGSRTLTSSPAGFVRFSPLRYREGHSSATQERAEWRRDTPSLCHLFSAIYPARGSCFQASHFLPSTSRTTFIVPTPHPFPPRATAPAKQPINDSELLSFSITKWYHSVKGFSSTSAENFLKVFKI